MDAAPDSDFHLSSSRLAVSTSSPSSSAMRIASAASSSESPLRSITFEGVSGCATDDPELFDAVRRKKESIVPPCGTASFRFFDGDGVVPTERFVMRTSRTGNKNELDVTQKFNIEKAWEGEPTTGGWDDGFPGSANCHFTAPSSSNHLRCTESSANCLKLNT